MNSFITVLLQRNKLKTERKLGEFVCLLGSGWFFGIPAFSFYLCALKWGNIADVVDGVSLEADILASFLGKMRMIVFLMTLFFQCWLHGSTNGKYCLAMEHF